MCQCGGASEHGHGYPKDTTVIKSLYDSIDHSRVICLNAKVNNISTVIRESSVEVSPPRHLESDVDAQLLLKIPFTGTVKLRSIVMRASRATDLMVWINQPAMDFSSVDAPCVQSWRLLSDTTDIVDYPCRAAKFLNVNHLTILISTSEHPSVALEYLGLRGEFSQARVGAVKADYEITPQLADHKNPAEVFNTVHRTGF